MKIKVADYIIQFLAKQGIRDVFVVYGSANGDLIDAFTRTENIRYVCFMHEQAAGFAAEGYARVTRKFGVAIATSGPGGHNLVTPIANCYYESVPALFITGQQNTRFMKKTNKLRQNAFQETEIVEIVTPITKYAKMVRQPDRIRLELERALHTMQSGRPGPVLLDIPLDVQKTEVETDTMPVFVPEDKHYSRGEIVTFIKSFLSDLKSASRPAVIVGGGVKLANCEREVRRFIKTLNTPAFPTWNAIDTIASDFDYYGGRIGTYGGDGRNFGIQNSDLLLCIGSRVSGRITGGEPASFARAAKKYIVDIDREILVDGQHDVYFDNKLCCDLKEFFAVWDNEEFSYILNVKGYDEFNPTPQTSGFADWNAKVQGWRKKYRVAAEPHIADSAGVDPYTFMDTLSYYLGDSDIVIADCGGNVVVTNQALQTKTGQLVFSNNGNSPMGFSFAAGIGARIAAGFGTKRVIAIIGDGGMNMNIQELQTILNYNVGLKLIILNNHIYGITKAFQKANFNGRFEACGPKGYAPPDFGKIAAAYGVDYVSLNTNNTHEISRIIVEFLGDPAKAKILSVECPDYHKYTPRIVGWKTPIEDMYPYLDRGEFKSNMLIQTVDGWEAPAMPSVSI